MPCTIATSPGSNCLNSRAFAKQYWDSALTIRPSPYAAKLGREVYAVSSGPSKAELTKSLGAAAHVDSSATVVVSYFKALGGAKFLICTASP